MGGWGAQFAKPQRYVQPAGTPVWAYLPPILKDGDGKRITWKKFFSAQPDTPLVITEGEKKAAAACAAGIAAIGLGGVRSFTNARKGSDGLPPLDAVSFSGRRVWIIFDTDDATGLKPEVALAAQALMQWLFARGAIPWLVVLPHQGAKTGLDDWLLTGKTAVDLAELVALRGTQLDDSRDLLKAAREWCYVGNLDAFAELEAGPQQSQRRLVKAANFDAITGLVQVTMRRKWRARVQGVIETRYEPTVLKLSEAALLWPGFAKLSGVTYRPGEGSVVDGRLNLWIGWRAEYEGPRARLPLPSPAERNHVVSEWQRAMDSVFGNDPEARAFAEFWLHYPVRHPGAKLFTNMHVWSPDGGIGKTFLGEMLLRHVYGFGSDGGPQHGYWLNVGDLDSAFTPYLDGVSFVLGDEIVAHNNRRDTYERIKTLVTADNVIVNQKFMKAYALENHINLYTTSNGLAFYLDEGDRRTFAHRPDSRAGFTRWTELSRLFKQGIGGPSLLWWARERANLGAWKPEDAAPMTQTKRDFINDSMTVEEAWLRELRMAAEDGQLSRTVASTRELTQLYELEEGVRPFANAFGALLSKVGARRFPHHMLVDGDRLRVWMLADFGRWLAGGAAGARQALATPLKRKVVALEASRRAKRS